MRVRAGRPRARQRQPRRAGPEGHRAGRGRRAPAADGARNAKVYFGAHQGTVVRFASDTELIVEAPGGKVGDKVDVLIIFEPGGELKIAKGFEYIEKHDVPLNADDIGKEGDKKK